MHPIDGTSMLSYLRGEKEYIHGPGKAVIYEMAGSAAVFQDGYNLTKNNPPFGNRQWRLYRPNEDPVEVNDLATAKPELVTAMLSEYQRFAEEVNLIEVPDDYHPLKQLQKNAARNQGKEATDTVPILD